MKALLVMTLLLVACSREDRRVPQAIVAQRSVDAAGPLGVEWGADPKRAREALAKRFTFLQEWGDKDLHFEKYNKGEIAGERPNSIEVTYCKGALVAVWAEFVWIDTNPVRPRFLRMVERESQYLGASREGSHVPELPALFRPGADLDDDTLSILAARIPLSAIWRLRGVEVGVELLVSKWKHPNGQERPEVIWRAMSLPLQDLCPRSGETEERGTNSPYRERVGR